MKSKMQIFQILFFFCWFCYEIFLFYFSWKIVEEQKLMLDGYNIRGWYYMLFNPIIALFSVVVAFNIKNGIERNKVLFFIPIFWMYALLLYILSPTTLFFVAVKIILFLAAPIYAFYWLKRRDLNLVIEKHSKHPPMSEKD